MPLAATEPSNLRMDKANKRKKDRRRQHLEHQQTKAKRRREVQVIEAHDPFLEDPPRIYASLKRCLVKEEKPVIIPAEEIEKN